MLERLFPNVPSTNVDYDTWLTDLSSHIEAQQQQQINQQNSVKSQKSTSNNHQNGDDDEDSDDNVTGNGTHHHSTHGNGTKITANLEELILQNAQLKSTVDEYKTIVADTVR